MDAHGLQGAVSDRALTKQLLRISYHDPLLLPRQYYGIELPKTACWLALDRMINSEGILLDD
jgi:hypothetical protein